MTEPRHYADQLSLSLLQRETTYGTPVTPWDATTALTMTDVDAQTCHELLEDLVVGMDLRRLGQTAPTQQFLVRQSVRFPYHEPHVTLQSLGGLLVLTLGTVVSAPHHVPLAMNHRITPAPVTLLPSITAQVRHQQTHQVRYPGIKAESLTLEGNSPYLSCRCPLMGSGTRTTVSDVFPPVLRGDWLRWGDCAFWLADVSAGPLAVPVQLALVQGESNLGAGALNLSSRVLGWSLQYGNGLAGDLGYRATTGKVRGDLRPGSQDITIRLELEVNTATEAAELAWHITQIPMAFEWQCVGAEIVTVTLTALTAGTPPRYHQVTDELGGTWYLYPLIVGAATDVQWVVDTAPPAGTGLATGTGLLVTAATGATYRLGANSLGEATAHEQSAAVAQTAQTLSYGRLLDDTGTPWYVWVSEVGDLSLGTALPTTLRPLWRTGATLIVPKLQWLAVVRQEEHQQDVLELTGTGLADGVNPLLLGELYGTMTGYLAEGA